MPLLGLLAAALAARVALGSAPQLDYDEGVYWQSLRALAHGHALYREVYSSQPPGFLPLVLPAFSLGGQSIAAARAGVALLSLALVAGAWLAARGPAGLVAAVAAAGLAAFDPLLLRGAVTLQADVPAVALAALAFGLLVAAGARTGRPAVALAAGAGALVAVGVLVKLLAAPALAGLLVLVVAGRRWSLLLAGLAGAVAATAVLLAPLGPDLGAAWQQSVLLHLGARGVGGGGLQSGWPAPPAFELAVLALAVAGLVASWRSPARTPALAAAAWLGAAILFLALQRPVYPHHVVAAMAPAVLLAGLGLGRFRAGPAALAGLVAAGMVATLAWLPAPSGPAPERLTRLVPAGRPVVTDDQYLAAAAGLDTPPWLVDTSRLRIASGDLTAARVESEIVSSRAGAVILGTGRLELLPGFEAWLAANYPERTDLGSGVAVYRQRA